MADYIDKESLLHKIGQMPTAWEYGQAVKDIYDMVKNEPAANVAPVVHGRWIFNDDWWEFRCTNCHKSIGNIEKYKYCPHCGARMDGTEDNEK